MRCLILILALLVPTTLSAHEGSVAFLSLTNGPSEARGALHLAIKDVDLHLQLDADADDLIRWGEVRSRLPEIDALVREHLRFNGTPPEILGHAVDDRMGVSFLVFNLHAPGIVTNAGYSFHFDADSSHRLIVQSEGSTFVLTDAQRSAALAHSTRWMGFLKHGTLHIWAGLDHILFLVALILPVTMRSRPDGRRAQAMVILKVVTAFTIAHSITLALAVLGLMNPPARLIESVIAGSVLLAAINNFNPLWNERAWSVAFVFGLFHGFGFAGPLVEAGLPAHALLPALGLFNLGVEAGQLGIVAVALPVLALLARSEAGRVGALRFGSMIIAAVAGIWLVQRVFDVAL